MAHTAAVDVLPVAAAKAAEKRDGIPPESACGIKEKWQEHPRVIVVGSVDNTTQRTTGHEQLLSVHANAYAWLGKALAGGKYLGGYQKF